MGFQTAATRTIEAILRGAIQRKSGAGISGGPPSTFSLHVNAKLKSTRGKSGSGCTA